MTDHLTKLTDRRSFLRRLLTTTSLVATGAASAPAWAQSHGAHGRMARMGQLVHASEASLRRRLRPPLRQDRPSPTPRPFLVPMGPMHLT